MGPSEGASPWAAEQSQAMLEALRFAWDTAYEINFSDGRWTARRLDDLGGPVEAKSPEELGQAILHDYLVKPVPRDLPGTPR